MEENGFGNLEQMEGLTLGEFYDKVEGQEEVQGNKHNVLMVSDFCYPNMGGVESHIFSLSLCLLRKGHKVVIMTHSFGNRKGVRHYVNGLKIYYVPFQPFFRNSTLPVFLTSHALFRNIIIREQIEIVHCHQAFSCMGIESLLHARTLGHHTVFTDHSLFGFSDASSIIMNKMLKFILSDVDHVICVSHTSKLNTVLRAKLEPEIVSTIPNAVDASSFLPSPSRKDLDYINIVVLSRLVYRKGIDLLVGAIPILCKRFSRIRFIIGGDGPKKLLLEEMREKYQLHDVVELLGAIKAHDVPKVLTRGHMFLNSSLTEAFCIAIVEAASCGLYVVSTKVGGVPEVLPPNMIKFCEPNVMSVVNAVSEAIPMLSEVHAQTLHDRVANMYHWDNVAERTEEVYDRIADLPHPPLVERIRRYLGGGPYAGIIFCMIVLVDYIFKIFIEWLLPEKDIDIAPTFPYAEYSENRKMKE